MMTDYVFPTLGEAAQALLNSTGLLAQKNNPSEILKDEKAKKTFQTKLRRLANEEGDVEKSFQDVAVYLLGLVTEATRDIRVANAFMASVEDLYHSFRNAKREWATYLDKENTVRWLFECGLADVVVKSAQKYSLMYGLAVSELSSPVAPNWWLPEFAEDKVVWPLEKVWCWIYETADTSQSRFHNPNGEPGRAQQNLENVERWFNRNRLPQWGELVTNLESSLALLAACPDPKYKRTLTESEVKSFRVHLFFARMATDVLKAIDKAFGREFIRQLCRDMKAQNRRLAQMHAQWKAEIELELTCIGPLAGREYYAFWKEAVHGRWAWFNHLMTPGLRAFQELLSRKEGEPLSLAELKQARGMLPSHILAALMRMLRHKLADKDKAFAEFFLEGVKLRKLPDLSVDRIEAYKKRIDAAGQSGTLSWLVEWMYATYFYRRNEHRAAYPHYRKAFDLAKHSIGEDTYLLINQYAESCAKNDKRNEFSQVIRWANHNGVKIRWYRGEDDHDKAIELAYTFLKMASYPVV